MVAAGSPNPSPIPAAKLFLQQFRFKSTAPLDHDEEEEAALDAALNLDADGSGAGSEMSNNTLESVADYTSDKSKSGTPSPWAVFDAWGAGADIFDQLSADEEYKLSKDSVAIPFTDDERAGMPDETSILGAYDHLLKRKSTSVTPTTLCTITRNCKVLPVHLRIYLSLGFWRRSLFFD